MKKCLFLIGLFSLFGCTKDISDKDDSSRLEKNNISEGFYTGYLVLGKQSYWCAIEFIDNLYQEWPSGGIYHQKEMSCLTTGSFIIENSSLSFRYNSFKFATHLLQCDSEMLLPGDYKIHLISMNDSLVFSKGSGENRIIYHLGRTTD